MLEATLELKRKHGLSSGDVERVQCDIFQTGYDIAGGGSFGNKDNPQTKEQADYNLKYLIAAALKLTTRSDRSKLTPGVSRPPMRKRFWLVWTLCRTRNSRLDTRGR